MAKDTIRNRKLIEEFNESVDNNPKLKRFGRCNLWVSEGISIARCLINFEQAVDANEYLFSLPAHTYIAQANVPVMNKDGSVIAFDMSAAGKITAVTAIASNTRCFVIIPVFIVN